MAERPLLSFVVLAYNQEAFVHEATTAALSQSYGPLQVVLSDDASTDATFEIMRQAAAAYSGPHEVVLNRNQSNLGTNRHLNAVAALVKGEVVVLGAGDDVSSEERAARVAEAYMTSGGLARSILSDYLAIDQGGNPLPGGYAPDTAMGYDDFLNDRLRAYGATQAVHRDVFAFFGDLPYGLHEDQVLFHRALLLGQWRYIPKKLVRYRRHGSNTTDAKRLSGRRRGFHEFWQRGELEAMIGNSAILQDYLRYCAARPEFLLPDHIRAIRRRLRRAYMMWSFFGAPLRRFLPTLAWSVTDRIGFGYLARSTRALLRLQVDRSRSDLS